MKSREAVGGDELGALGEELDRDLHQGDRRQEEP